MISIYEKDLGYTIPYNSIVLHIVSWGGNLEITKEDGSPFSLKSMRFLRPKNRSQAESVKLTAYFHTRGNISQIINIPSETEREGLEYNFSGEWSEIGMKKLKIEFMELKDGEGSTRFGAVDDVVFYDKVLE